MSVNELFLRLAELILLGEGNKYIDMSADGYLFDISEIYNGDYNTIVLGDSEQKGCNEFKGIEPTKAGNVKNIVITDKSNFSVIVKKDTDSVKDKMLYS